MLGFAYFVSQDPQLLSLLARLEVGDEIPQDMYTAVAVILSWVYWLKGMQPGEEAKDEPEDDQAAKAD